MNDTVQSIITRLQDFREDYNSKIENVQKDFKLKFSLIQNIVKKFYNDLELVIKEDYLTLDILSKFQKNYIKFCYSITNEYKMEQFFTEFETKINLEKSLKLKIETLVKDNKGNFTKLENINIKQNSLKSND